MQSRASDVVTTAEKYLERIEGLLKDADIDDALRVLKDQLVLALTAIKLSTAERPEVPIRARSVQELGG